MLVVASMIGTGIFTTSGFLLRDLGSPGAVLIAWVIGGLLAFCGATSYAELGAAVPRSGAEYALLGRIYSPAIGFAFGWTSLVVGFAAPIAASAIAFGQYLGAAIPGAPPLLSAILLIAGLSVLHTLRLETGSAWQDGLTLAKIALIVALCLGGIFTGDVTRLVSSGEAPLFQALISPELAVGLIFVSYAYSGWNAAAYVAGEVRDPGRVLPRALLAGTAIVTLSYVALNVMYFSAAPAAALTGVVEVAAVAASHAFGEGAGRLVSFVIAFGLVPSTGALLMTGARVTEAMGRDHPLLAPLSRRTTGGAPAVSIALQSLLALVMVLSAGFDTLLTYVGFTLTVAAALTAAGVIVLRRKEPGLHRPHRAWAYPLTPLVFVGASAWMTVQALRERPVIAVFGLATIGTGLVLYFLLRLRSPRKG